MHAHYIRAMLLASLPIFAAAPPALAQAFMPPQGEGTVSVVLQDSLVRRHLLLGAALDRGHIRAQSLVIDASYGLSDKVAISMSVPYVRSKYYGNFPHQLPIDD